MTLSYNMNKAELTKAMHIHFRHKGKTWIIVWLLAGLFMLYFGISLLMSSSDKGLGIICCLLSTVFFFRQQIAIWRSVKRTFANKPSSQRITITASEEQLQLITESANTTAGWNNFIDARITKDGILLYSQKNIFNWIPQCPVENGSWDQFAALVADKVKST